MARWRGNRTEALDHALVAHDVFQRIGSPVELTRMRLSLVGIYLDFASPQGIPPVSSDRGSIIQLTERLVMDSLAQSRTYDDSAGEALALLSYARYIRAAGRDESALGTISMVEDLARRLDDSEMLAIAYTIRGGELMAGGKTEQAISSFREAIELLSTSEVPVQAVWSRRALLAAEEMT